MIYTARYDDLLPQCQHLEAIELLTGALKMQEGIDYGSEPILVNAYGKPHLANHPDIHYNISHCRDYIACILSRDYEVGIDVEDIRSFADSVARRVCAQSELDRIYTSECRNTEFFRHWTLKESYLKAIGQGLSFQMKNVVFDEITTQSIGCNQGKCHFRLLTDSEYIIAVCYKNA